MGAITELVRGGPAGIGLTIGLEIEEALADPAWVAWWLPKEGARLLIAGERGWPFVFSDTGAGHGWQRVEPAVVAQAGFGPAFLARALEGSALEVWLAGEPAALYPYDLLAYRGVDVRDRPTSERLVLLQQLVSEIRVPGRWFQARALTGSATTAAVVAPDGLRPLLRRLARPYPLAGARSDWRLPLR